MIEKIEDLIYTFYKLYHKLEQLNLDNTIKCLTQNEIHIIRLIGTNSLIMNELKDKLDTTLGSTSTAINKLENKKFVERKKDKKDKRKVYVSLTEKGLMAYEVYEKVHKELIKKAINNIEEENLEKFYNTFNKIKNNLIKIQKEYKPINLFELEIGEIAIIEDIKLSYAGFKYVYEKGVAIGKEVKILEKSKNILKLDTFKGIKALTEEDAKDIYCIKKEV